MTDYRKILMLRSMGCSQREIIITDGKSIQQKSEHNNTYMMQRNATKK